MAKNGKFRIIFKEESSVEGVGGCCVDAIDASHIFSRRSICVDRGGLARRFRPGKDTAVVIIPSGAD
jgi:hypothetical protein